MALVCPVFYSHMSYERYCCYIYVCVCSGEVGSGKTTLVAKLQGVDEYMKGRGLEYLYFSVHDDDIDGNARPAGRSFMMRGASLTAFVCVFQTTRGVMPGC